MPRTEFDVFLSFHEPTGRDLAATLAAGLARRGFRVFTGSPAEDPADSRLARIREIPDFVLVLTPGCPAPGPAPLAPMFADAEQAVRAGRNVVQVLAPGAADLRAADLPGELEGLRQGETVEFQPGRLAESIALVAHRLSSDAGVDERRVMRRGKRLFAAAAAILLVGIALQEIPRLIERWSRPGLLKPIPPFALYWTAFGQRQEGGRWLEFEVAKDCRVRGGDQVRLAFSPSADGYAYAVARDRQGEVFVLFPTDAVAGASRVRAGQVYDVPVGGSWHTVDEQAGLDALYLVGGYDQLQNLEELIEEPAAVSGARRVLLESTIQGLLDGRHGAAERRVWTGKLHPIDRELAIPGGPARFSVPLASGAPADHALLVQPGLVSASVEIPVRFVGPPLP